MDADERILADQQDVRVDDLAVFDGKGVERAAELVARHDQRRGRSALVPARRDEGEGVEVVHRQRADERQAVRPFGGGASVRDHGLEAGAEDPLQIGNDTVEATAGRRIHICSL